MSARGDSRNASGLQQYRNEKNEPNEHGLPPTIAYGARIIGAKLARGNTETPYTTRACRNDNGPIRRRRVDQRTHGRQAGFLLQAATESSVRTKDCARDSSLAVAPPFGAMSGRAAASRPSIETTKRNCKDQVWLQRNSSDYCKIWAISVVDKLILVHSEFPMRRDKKKMRRFMRPIVAAAVACLLFQQALGLIFSNGRHGGDLGAFLSSPVAMANELCADQADGDGKAPHVQHMHCMACFLSDRSDDLGSKVLLSAVVLVLAPVSEAPPLWPEERDLAPPTTQWPRNRLSRAPPSLLS
ncbi:hypothetical protein [Methylocystis sp.]|uniref:hypothetical protein n=1 Tax=Methylocystis sp. TaxID=1911079 RepID=UPI003DA21677